jgi:hypothetical protein
MSFNVMAEGVIDYGFVAARIASFQPLEVFPIPPSREGELPALGIACPSSRCGEDAARALDRVVRFLWTNGLVVYELWSGRAIVDETGLAELCAKVRTNF